jgi:hypothetical protein
MEEDYLAVNISRSDWLFKNAPVGPAFFEHWWDERPETMELPVLFQHGSLYDQDVSVARGTYYTTNKQALLGYLRKMGWAEYNECHEVVYLSESMRGRVKDYFYGYTKSLHDVVFLNNCPDNMLDAVRAVFGIGSMIGTQLSQIDSDSDSSSDSDSDSDILTSPPHGPFIRKSVMKALYLVEKMRVR